MKPATPAPAFAIWYAQFAKVARDHGYALAIHGTLARDVDLIAVPWVDGCSEPETLVNAIAWLISAPVTHGPEQKTNGRLAWTIGMFDGSGIDLSVIAPNVQIDDQRLVVLRQKLSDCESALEKAEARLAPDPRVALLEAELYVAICKHNAVYQLAFAAKTKLGAAQFNEDTLRRNHKLNEVYEMLTNATGGAGLYTLLLAAGPRGGVV